MKFLLKYCIPPVADISRLSISIGSAHFRNRKRLEALGQFGERIISVCRKGCFPELIQRIFRDIAIFFCTLCDIADILFRTDSNVVFHRTVCGICGKQRILGVGKIIGKLGKSGIRRFPRFRMRIKFRKRCPKPLPRRFAVVEPTALLAIDNRAVIIEESGCR